MKLNTKAFAFAAGIAAAATFTVCASFVAIAPTPTTAFFSTVTHLDLTGLARPITWGTYIVGVVFWSFWAAGLFGLAGWIYNAMSPADAESVVSARHVTQGG